MKLKKSDAYQVCREFHSDCICERMNTVPCIAVAIVLKVARGDPKLAIELERGRIAENLRLAR